MGGTGGSGEWRFRWETGRQAASRAETRAGSLRHGTVVHEYSEIRTLVMKSRCNLRRSRIRRTADDHRARPLNFFAQKNVRYK